LDDARHAARLDDIAQRREEHQWVVVFHCDEQTRARKLGVGTQPPSMTRSR